MVILILTIPSGVVCVVLFWTLAEHSSDAGKAGVAVWFSNVGLLTQTTLLFYAYLQISLSSRKSAHILIEMLAFLPSSVSDCGFGAKFPEVAFKWLTDEGSLAFRLGGYVPVNFVTLSLVCAPVSVLVIWAYTVLQTGGYV
eukprot:ANDGO_01309.mRNA.1 hypothetical protein